MYNLVIHNMDTSGHGYKNEAWKLSSSNISRFQYRTYFKLFVMTKTTIFLGLKVGKIINK